ncbi:MAG TPA: DNA-processing protein DprA [Candidatus Binataceae bacterium]|nr:DNA-processing protein DprA [Candidatus Binataceae bacterium]
MPSSPDVYWLALRQVRGVGPRVYRLLLENFSSPQAAFEAGNDDLIRVGVPKITIRNILDFRNFDAAEKELCELPRVNAKLVKWHEPEYPPNLRHIADPPPFLYLRGTLLPDEKKCIAIVGARAASDAGRHMARRLGLELSAKGLAVVSGLARGIDSEAHLGALDAGGRTIAVMGCGIDVIYPGENRKLAEAIVESGGALITELPVGTPPSAENFPGRNRILSGLSLGAIIVEAAEKSGSLITARLALEQDREVFAVPGSPLTGKARGSNRLIREGAKLVECVEDVLEELAPQLAEVSKPIVKAPQVRISDKVVASNLSDYDGDPEEEGAKNLLNYLKEGSKLHVDALIEGSGLSASTVLKLLLDLELKGIVAQHPGKLFSLAHL